MYSYIIGKVIDFNGCGITLDNNGIGYFINTPNPFGFKTVEEKDMFLKLISVKGMGCKLALPILATGSVPGIVDAIERENILYLKKFPKIGDKVAKQMILDLKGKLNNFEGIEETTGGYEELSDVLKGLGYKDKEFKNILPKVPSDLSIEDQVKEALKLLLK